MYTFGSNGIFNGVYKRLDNTIYKISSEWVIQCKWSRAVLRGDVDGLVKKSQPIVTHIGLQFTPKEFNECFTTNYIHHVVRERNCTRLLHADNYKKTCYLWCWRNNIDASKLPRENLKIDWIFEEGIQTLT